MGPKFRSVTKFDFYNGNEYISKFDSIWVIFFDPNSVDHPLDTAYPNEWRRDVEQNLLLFQYGQYSIEQGSEFNYMIVNVIYKNQHYSSGKLSHNSYRGYYQFELTNQNTLVESSFLHTTLFNYFLSFLITIILELLVARAFVKAEIGQDYNRFIYFLLLVNIISHPTMWYLQTNTEIAVFLTEIGVIIFETIFLSLAFFRFRIGEHNMFEFALLANIASWWIGGTLYYMVI